MVASYFEHFGLPVLTAGDTDEAMQRAHGLSLGVVILDVNLPGKGSVAFMEFLKQNHPKTPIILYTGRQSEDDLVADMLARGAKRYLLKDGSLETLLGVVKELNA